MSYLRRKVAAACYFRWMQKESALGIAVTEWWFWAEWHWRWCSVLREAVPSVTLREAAELCMGLWSHQHLLVLEAVSSGRKKRIKPKSCGGSWLCFAAWKYLRVAALQLYPLLACAEEHWAGWGDALFPSGMWPEEWGLFSPENCCCPVFSQQREKSFSIIVSIRRWKQGWKFAFLHDLRLGIEKSPASVTKLPVQKVYIKHSLKRNPKLEFSPSVSCKGFMAFYIVFGMASLTLKNTTFSFLFVNCTEHAVLWALRGPTLLGQRCLFN